MSTAYPQSGTYSNHSKPSDLESTASWSDPFQIKSLILLVLMALGLVLAYRDTLEVCWRAWADPQYSHGYLIPIFTLVMLWVRREYFVRVPLSQRYMGLGLLAFGLIVRIISGMVYMVPLELLSFLASVFGVFMLIGGYAILRWAGPWLGFLIFMFPLPSVLEHQILDRLKYVATIIATYFLQMLGFAVHNVGNVIHIEGVPVEVADVCSGLRMATIFGAMAVGLVLLIERPWWDKLIILISALPIALFVNVIRIAVTSIVHWAYQGNETVIQQVHDYAGYAMPILALGLLWFVLAILDRLTLTDTDRVAPIYIPGAIPVPRKRGGNAD